MCTRTASSGSGCASVDITTPPLASGGRQSSQTRGSWGSAAGDRACDTVPPCTNLLRRRPAAGRCWSSPAPAAAAPACSPGSPDGSVVHIPKPEVSANRSNPRGFGEPRWLVDYHNELLATVDVVIEDGRPGGLGPHRPGRRAARGRWTAWRPGSRSSSRRTTGSWSRTPGWRGSSSCTGPRPTGSGAEVHVATMLRHPAEVMRSREIAYGTKTNNTTRVVGWMTMMLGTELRSRDLPRATVRYDDLLVDWRSAMTQADETIRMGLFDRATPEQIADAGDLVDPHAAPLHRRLGRARAPAAAARPGDPHLRHLRPAGRRTEPPTQARRRAQLDEIQAELSGLLRRVLRRRPYPHRRQRASREAQGRQPRPRGAAAPSSRRAASPRSAGPWPGKLRRSS